MFLILSPVNRALFNLYSELSFQKTKETDLNALLQNRSTAGGQEIGIQAVPQQVISSNHVKIETLLPKADLILKLMDL